MRALALALAVIATACGSPSPVGKLRFHNAPPVWRVADDKPLRKEPATREYYRGLYYADANVFRRITRALELRPHQRAKDVNSIDEVPDSSWFHNRIGIRDYSIEELKRGPNMEDTPFAHRPWTIVGGKVGGKSIGFIFRDAKQRKYLLKFDAAANPELETGAHVIVHRILWAIGYHVPQDHVGHIRRQDLIVGDHAKKHGIDDAKLEAALKLVYTRDDGSIRVLASQFVPGKPIGPYAGEGVRGDDPNDTIPHEHRRTLRGQYPIFAWLNHTDVKEANTIDSFDKGFVTHYLIDFGMSLGVMATHNLTKTPGHAFRFDFKHMFEDLFTFGLLARLHEGQEQSPLRGIGVFDAEHYDPGSWKPRHPYLPLLDKDRDDAFWGSKLLMRFKPHEIAMIVDEAQFSDPRSKQYMVETLIHRQRATARYWFDRIAPLDAFTVAPSRLGVRLCFTDLTLSYKLRTSATTYSLGTYDHDGQATGFRSRFDATSGGRSCTEVPLAPTVGGYTIVHLHVRRGQQHLPPMLVHIVRDASGGANLIGLRR